ncbi:MAG: retron St85 family effector protein [Spirochaetales bacterium]|nr:retron St85 family effector protein [Spirochaetales bacterium]
MKLRDCISSSKLFLSKDSYIIFICGASAKIKSTTARSVFIEYAKKYLQGIDFFIAEDFFQAFSEKGNISDLLSIEDNIANYSDCILLFIESPGAIAELGAFANNKKLLVKILAINDKDERNSPSFITQGPIAKINRKSIFKPVLYAKMNASLEISSEIKRLLLENKRKRNKKIYLETFRQFKKTLPKLRMLFIFDLITIFQPVNILELIFILKKIYGNHLYNLHAELTMLKILEFIEEKKGFLLRKNTDYKFYFVYKGIDLLKIRAEILISYNKTDHEKINLLNTVVEPYV